MSSLSEKLALTKLEYTAKHVIKYDPVEKVYIGTVNNSDLAIVLKNKSKEKLDYELEKAVEMHCYMFSMDAIHTALSLAKFQSTHKPACNILVPAI